MPDKQIYNPRYRALVARLKHARLSLGLSQAQVARRLGLCRTWVAKIECCELRLDLLHFVKLCRLYGLRASEVIGGME